MLVLGNPLSFLGSGLLCWAVVQERFLQRMSSCCHVLLYKKFILRQNSGITIGMVLYNSLLGSKLGEGRATVSIQHSYPYLHSLKTVMGGKHLPKSKITD